jgi:N-acetylglucosaminyl-diphospho-decaprenol L-rhamnosyltransferase
MASRESIRRHEAARGEYILFLNPDTISNEKAYLHCLGRLQKDEMIGIISPRLVTANGVMDYACRRSIPTIWDGFARASGMANLFPNSKLFGKYNLTYLPEVQTYAVGAVNGAFMMCPRKALMRFGLFDEQYFMYGEDLDLCYRASKAGYQVIYDGTATVIHLKGVSSAREYERMSRELFRGSKQFYLKHFNPHHSRLTKWKYDVLFGAWALISKGKARIKGHHGVRPL